MVQPKVYFSPKPDTPYEISVGKQPGIHVYDRNSIEAIRAAFNAERPLLIRGEPGIGKSQLAYAAAAFLKWPILPFTVTATTESTDLLWHFDAVARLAEAQVKADGIDMKQRLAFKRFLKPGVLWWAFNWKSARDQAANYLADCPDDLNAGGDGTACKAGVSSSKKPLIESAPFAQPETWEAGQGCVVLIDEIDKADSDLPNSLLEALGNWQFTVPYLPQESVIALPDTYCRPLVLITTNNERQLPPAFVRRCLVLDITLPPESEREELKRKLVNYAAAHFPAESQEYSKLFQEAAECLCQDRELARQASVPAPSVAEFIDLLRIILNPPAEETRSPAELLEIAKKFVLGKHRRDTD